MKRFTRLTIAAVIAMTTMTACKTTEENYRNAYERTINATDSTRTEFDQTIYGRYRRQMRDVYVRHDGDTISTKAQRVTVTKDVTTAKVILHRYNVVVGEFKQLFNAKSMCERLIDAGYAGAFVVETAEPYYFVIADSYSMLGDALARRDSISVNPPFRLKEDLPYILQASQLM